MRPLVLDPVADLSKHPVAEVALEWLLAGVHSLVDVQRAWRGKGWLRIEWSAPTNNTSVAQNPPFSVKTLPHVRHGHEPFFRRLDDERRLRVPGALERRCRPDEVDWELRCGREEETRVAAAAASAAASTVAAVAAAAASAAPVGELALPGNAGLFMIPMLLFLSAPPSESPLSLLFSVR